LTAGQRYCDMRFFGFNWFSQNNPSELLINQIQYFRFWFKFAERFEFKVLLCILRIQTVLYGGFSVYVQFHSTFFSVLYVKFHSVFSENTCSANLFQDLCNSAYSAKWHSFIPRVLYSIHMVWFGFLLHVHSVQNVKFDGCIFKYIIFFIRFEEDITGKLECR
jgi:hypothetical protein